MHFEKVDIDEAFEVVGDVFELYRMSRLQSNAPAFSGGVLDAWPNWAVTAFAVLRQEETNLRAWVESKRAKDQPRG